mgnify:CR=1 FL=1
MHWRQVPTILDFLLELFWLGGHLSALTIGSVERLVAERVCLFNVAYRGLHAASRGLKKGCISNGQFRKFPELRRRHAVLRPRPLRGRGSKFALANPSATALSQLLEMPAAG